MRYALRQLLILFILPWAANAQTSESQSVSQGSTSLYGGLNLGGGVLDMGDVNDDLRAIGLDKISHGASYGATVGSIIAGSIGLSANFRRYGAAQSAQGPTGSLEFRVPGNALYGSADLLVACPQTPGLCGLGVSAGAIWTRGSLGLSITDEGCLYEEFTANGLYVDSHIVVIASLNSLLSLEIRGGYRSAKAENADLGRHSIYNLDGASYSVSYSGVFLSLGITATILGGAR